MAGHYSRLVPAAQIRDFFAIHARISAGLSYNIIERREGMQMPWTERITPDWSHWNLTAWLRRPLPEAVLQRFEEPQEVFEVRFLEDLLARVGEAPDILTHLGYLYTQSGRHRDALAVDRRLVALRPRDPVAHYNLACSYSNLGRINQGFAALKEALALGFRDVEQIQEDEDLENLRGHPRWGELLSVLNR